MRKRFLVPLACLLVAAAVASDETPLTGFTPARARAPRARGQKILAPPPPAPPAAEHPPPPYPPRLQRLRGLGRRPRRACLRQLRPARRLRPPARRRGLARRQDCARALRRQLPRRQGQSRRRKPGRRAHHLLRPARRRLPRRRRLPARPLAALDRRPARLRKSTRL